MNASEIMNNVRYLLNKHYATYAEIMNGICHGHQRKGIQVQEAHHSQGSIRRLHRPSGRYDLQANPEAQRAFPAFSLPSHPTEQRQQQSNAREH
jgi:hypothetical protein